MDWGSDGGIPICASPDANAGRFDSIELSAARVKRNNATAIGPADGVARPSAWDLCAFIYPLSLG